MLSLPHLLILLKSKAPWFSVKLLLAMFRSCHVFKKGENKAHIRAPEDNLISVRSGFLELVIGHVHYSFRKITFSDMTSSY